MRLNVNWQRVFMLSGLMSLAVLYALLWAQMINSKTERVGSDFIGLYTGARLSQSASYSSIYAIEKQQNIQADVVGFAFHPDQTGYFTHPPFVVPLVALITSQDYALSLARWTLILLGFHALNTFLLLQSLPKDAFTKSERWLLAAGVFLFLPTFSGLMNGQDVAILLLGVTLWMLQLLNEKPFSAGVGLGLAVIRPQLALMLAVPFLARHRKVFAGFFICGLALALFSLVLIGMRGTLDYLQIVRVVEGGLWNHSHAKDMPAISGFLRRNFETMNQDLFRAFIWGAFLAGLAALSLWWRKAQQIGAKEIGLLVLLGLILVPYAHYHELTLLLIPIFCLIHIWAQKKRIANQILVSLPLAASLLMLSGLSGSGAFKYPAVYLIMAANAYFLLFSDAPPSALARFLTRAQNSN
ncbi:MAG: hypothetical protein CO094_10565 [Anaerolineae bacterium CG_4_9_14_3_um_filter_57_17]|nr:MAG: hypothetical protein CO094_10565 [Anaerolineae bacterium CG_4_9_14_3_um_filter_57_17]